MRTMLRAARTALCLFLLLLALAMVACQPSAPEVEPPNLDPLGFGGDFSLTAHDGRPFRLQDFRGRAVVLFFGYTSCPDMCPLTMSRIASARDQLGAQASEVSTLFVSVDTNRDTPAVLKEYVASFTMPVTGLTGSETEIATVADAYHAGYQLVAASPSYLMNHTTDTFIIDRQGRLRGRLAYNEKPETLAAALRVVLNQ